MVCPEDSPCLYLSRGSHTPPACLAHQVPVVFLKQLVVDKALFKDLPPKVQRQVSSVGHK